MVKHFGYWITVECLAVVAVVVAKKKCNRYCIMYIPKILLRSTVFAGLVLRQWVKNCLGLILIINLYNQCVLICSWCIVSIIRLFRLHNMHQGFLARRKCKNAIIPVWCQWCGAMVRKLTTAGKWDYVDRLLLEKDLLWNNRDTPPSH